MPKFAQILIVGGQNAMRKRKKTEKQEVEEEKEVENIQEGMEA